MRVAIFILLTALPATAWAQYFGQNKVQYESFDFQVMRTDHFDVYHYPDEAAAVAQAARLAEAWRVRLGAALGHELRGRQPLVLYASSPHFQQTNVVQGMIGEGTGGVTEFLKRRMVLPFTTSLGETSHVLGHELVHAYQYDMGGQGALGLPLWFVEGMAEYLSLGGDHPLTAMWLRDAALRDKLPGLDDLDNPQLFPYRYGHAAWAYLAGRFGEDVVPNIYLAAAQRGDVLGSIEAITGVSIDQLSSDWHAAILRAVEPVRAADRRPGRSLFGETVDENTLNVSPAISPDGRWIAFLSTRDVFSVDLYLAEAETGRVVRRLTKTATDAHFESLQFIASAGAWDSASRRLAFTAVSRGEPTLNVIDIERPGDLIEHRLPNVQEAWHPSWSPDGRRIVFSGLTGGVSDLFVLDVESGQAENLTRDAFADFEPAWSPDGKRIAFVTDRFTSNLERLEFGDYRLGVVAADGGTVAPLPGFDRGKHINPQWLDANTVLLVAEPDGRANVFRLELASSRLTPVTDAATGISGITELSPPMSFAPGPRRLVFTVFLDGGYAMQLLDVGGEPARYTRTEAASRLPGAGNTGVLAQGQARAEQLVPEARSYPVEPYKPDLSLDFVGGATGFNLAGQYGNYANGGISMLFSDMLNQHQIGATIQTGGQLRDIGGQVIYLNSERRWTWGAIGGVIPYVTGAFGQRLDTINGQSVLVEDELIERQMEADVTGVAQYPFSRASRFEVQTGARRLWFDRDLTSRVFSLQTGEYLGDTEEELETLSGLTLGESSAALVYDQAVFGATGPIVGQRYRFEAGQTFGSLRFSSVTLDYRRYVSLGRPFTLAVRGLHFGRYGGSSEDSRLSPLFLGYGTLVRGYDVNSFGADECVSDGQSDCPTFDQLLGSRLLVGNAEIRVPLVGAFSGEYRYGPLPIDAFAFADTGVAWNSLVSPSFAGGSRDLVSSVGAGVRANVFGYAVLEFAAARPLSRPGQGWMFAFNLAPGF